MTVAVVAEKPSVARDIASVLGARCSGSGCWHGGGYVVTWALGHLVGLAQPHEIEAAWQTWRKDLLPMLPKRWPLVVYESTKAHFSQVKAVLNDPQVDTVVCATDAGREGELIFRYIYRTANCRKPVQRLWISSLTPDAIRSGFARLQPSRSFDSLANAAEARSRADWLVGMNLSRAYTLQQNTGVLSVGRVQTPTLAMLVQRELAIRDFVAKPYCEVQATFDTPHGPYRATYFDPSNSRDHGTPDKPDVSDSSALSEKDAVAIQTRCKDRQGVIVSVKDAHKTLPPPELFDLTELQRQANRIYGYTAETTLKLAQSLYETHKLITYPRTDSRHLSSDIATTLADVVRVIAPAYGDKVAAATLANPIAPLSQRFVHDAKVTDHHAIIPTATSSHHKRLSRDEARIYDLVCRRLLMAWHAPHKTKTTTVVTNVASDAHEDLFRCSATVVMQQGWKVLEVASERSAKERASSPVIQEAGVQEAGDQGNVLARLAQGQSHPVVDVQVLHKTTTPPKRFTDAALLTAMETAGKQVDDKELEQAMRERGLGTPATRAAILETLVARGYVTRQGKSLVASQRGIELIEIVDARVKSPQLTGEWEHALQQMERGHGTLEAFMTRIESFVSSVVADVTASGAGRAADSAVVAAQSKTHGAGTRRHAELPTRHVSRVLEMSQMPQMSQEAQENQETQSPQTPEWLDDEGPLDEPDWLDTSEQSGRWQDYEADCVTLHKVPDPPNEHWRWGQGDAGPSGRDDAREVRPTDSVQHAMELAPARVHGGEAASGPRQLDEVLHRVFGFSEFRPYQREVCEAIAQGQDGLLVMPTGSGKSLCYQLPGIARGGVTVVVSPLIALMDDQASKLSAIGVRAQQVHSGRSRSASRQACDAYLKGELDFLFIAPERLAVPGFPEMLAKRKPALIAVDEAHCISHWGHDFRPDYRLLGERLPLLRPSPILALTATATVLVQDDIVQQLGIPQARRFIRGFRRDNIAIEAIECRVMGRGAMLASVLAQPGRLPAIVYVPTRANADSFAKRLSRRWRVKAYHAGMEPSERARVQQQFVSGELECVVATVAFGMGIDKADIRTVIHTAMPGSIEAYYQEIGRAGRDGKPSRAILFHSYADRHLLDMFVDKAFPPPQLLQTLLGTLPRDGVDRSAWMASMRLKPEVAETCVNKLWLHGAIRFDEQDRAFATGRSWQSDYLAIRDHRFRQVQLMFDFARPGTCRMVRLIKHFGDRGDDRCCGLCDACAPASVVAGMYRSANPTECEHLERLLREIEPFHGDAAGALFRRLFDGSGVSRAEFERWVDALARAGLVSVTQECFEKDGQPITYRRLHRGPRYGESVGQVQLLSVIGSGGGAKGNGAARRKSRFDLDSAAGTEDTDLSELPVPRRRRGSVAQSSGDGAVGKVQQEGAGARRRGGGGANLQSKAIQANADPVLVEKLRHWRLGQARLRKVPAFRILTDRTLLEIATLLPQTREQLLHVHGVGPKIADKYGVKLLQIVQST